MPSSDPLDPTNYTSLIAAGVSGWHSGTGSVTYSFLSSMPSYYTLNGAGTYDIGLGETVSVGQNISLSVTQRSMAEEAVRVFNEVANINLIPAATGGNGTTSGAPITGNGTLVSGLGGTSGYGELEVPRNDDGSQLYDISAVFESGLNFGGASYTDLYVNTNGSVSFGSGISTYSPTTISGSTGTPLIAPLWADVDTNIPANNGTDSAPIFVDIDATNDVLTFTWGDVGYYNQNGDKKNSYQLQLFDRGSGDFDIVFRYDDINWTTGDASDGVNGLGGIVGRAGYSGGNGEYYELAASGNQSGILNLDSTAGNTGTTGLWAFEIRNGSAAIGDVTFGVDDMTNDPSLYGFAGFPDTADSEDGDIWLNNLNTEVANPTFFDEGWDTFIHELGHAVGLDHPFDGTTLPAALDNSQYTIMSYDPHPDQDGIADPAQQFPATPMLYDIQALQAMYGANMNTRAGDTTYFASGSTPGFEIADGGQLIATVWDAGGEDTFDASDQSLSVTLDLRPGHFSTVGSIDDNIGIALGVAGTTAQSADIENAIGGSAGDLIIGNELDNELTGNAGGDLFDAMGGDDRVFDGLGNDDVDLGDDDDYVRVGGGMDTFDGGAGRDYISYYDSTGGVTLDLAANTASGSWADNDTVMNFEGVSGSSTGDDVIRGTDGANEIRTYGGNDVVYDRMGTDIVELGSGDDYVRVGGGVDLFDGGSGKDYISYYDSTGGVTLDLDANTAAGSWAANDLVLSFESVSGSGTGGDEISGTSGSNTIRTYGGNDTVYDRGGEDIVELGSGNDYVRVGGGLDSFDGGSGKDYISYYDSSNGVTLDLEANTASGSWAANDTVLNFESATGSGTGDDVIRGTSGSNTIRTYGGDDDVYDRAGNDIVQLGSGNDYVRVGGGTDSYDGGSGSDYISYYDSVGGVTIDLAANTASGGKAGGDTIMNFESVGGSSGGGDDIRADSAANTLRGYGGEDLLSGRGGADRLYGGDDRDFLYGGGDADILRGENGNDFLDGGGGSGTDLLYGGAGMDQFHFDRGEGDDVVKDFQNNVDVIEFDNFGYLTTAADALGFATASGGNVLFDFGADGTVLVENTTTGQLLNDIDIV